MAMKSGPDMPFTEQQRYRVPSDLAYTTAIPRCKEFDLEETADEGTFLSPKHGNEVYAKGSDK